MLQAILGKLYLISLFVSLYVLFSAFVSFHLRLQVELLCFLSHREGRASLASVAHRTHFQTLSNVARNGSAWPDRPDDADRADPSKLPDLPVRRRHSPIFGPLRKPSFTICFLFYFSWRFYHTRSSRATRVLMEVHGTRNLRDHTQCDYVVPVCASDAPDIHIPAVTLGHFMVAAASIIAVCGIPRTVSN